MYFLPVDYIEQMKRLLGNEFGAFIGTYDMPPTRSLRSNQLKISPEKLVDRVPFQLEPIPWCNEGLFYQHEIDRPGKHVYHAAGLYYIQDASAMAPVEALQPQPGEKILDLCAAPGGKTTQIAAKMKGKGLLVSNEIDPVRIKALVENVERCGVTNAIVLNELPSRLSSRFNRFFDRILVDAPCSGEGMFRKDHDACERWSLRSIEKCSALQLDILSAAATMLRPGGRLVYSTCTFNPTENESLIQRFLELAPSFQLNSVPKSHYYQQGRPDWLEHSHIEVKQTARLWPHLLRGEGHFVAVLSKDEEDEGKKQRSGTFPSIHADAMERWKKFVSDTYTQAWLYNPLTLFGEHLYQTSPHLPSLKGIKVERPGRYLGQVKKGRFVPSHALALSSDPALLQRKINFTVDDPRLASYLQGEALSGHLEKGWTMITVDHFPLGWGKSSDGLLKNHYPKWLRWA